MAAADVVGPMAKKPKLGHTAEIVFVSAADGTSNAIELTGCSLNPDGGALCEVVLSADGCVATATTAQSDAMYENIAEGITLEVREDSHATLIERDKDVREDLPDGWMMLTHESGMPVYIHRLTGVCTLARPYQLGSRSVHKHDLPIAGIPCLVYQLEKEREGGASDGGGTGVHEAVSEAPQRAEAWQPLPVQAAAASKHQQQPLDGGDCLQSVVGLKTHITPQELNKYCRRLFEFRRVAVPPEDLLLPAGTVTKQSFDRSSALSAPAAAAGSATTALAPLPPADDHKFMDTDEVLKLLIGSSPLECVPCGSKDNASFVVRNEKNDERRSRGKRSHFNDDCGSWCSKGATTSRTAFIVGEDGELKTAVYLYNGQWGSRRFVNASIRFVPIAPQPSADELLVLFRYYSRLRSNPSFQRRISWVGQRPPWIPASVMGKAIYEYRGVQQARLPAVAGSGEWPCTSGAGALQQQQRPKRGKRLPPPKDPDADAAAVAEHDVALSEELAAALAAAAGATGSS